MSTIQRIYDFLFASLGGVVPNHVQIISLIGISLIGVFEEQLGESQTVLEATRVGRLLELLAHAVVAKHLRVGPSATRYQMVVLITLTQFEI